ncbi:hypothetical protein BKA65DRAFT_390225, partial [Rhexocercosporidium sp. MPI-PUGE-AT-0058]
LPQARILTFGYDANVANWRTFVSKNTIGSHTRALLAALATYKEDDHIIADFLNSRPIIFIAHSLSGLVCEDVNATSCRC